MIKTWACFFAIITLSLQKGGMINNFAQANFPMELEWFRQVLIANTVNDLMGQSDVPTAIEADEPVPLVVWYPHDV